MNIPTAEILVVSIFILILHINKLELSHREICYDLNINGKDLKSIKLKGLINH